MKRSVALVAWLCSAAPLAAAFEVSVKLEPERIGLDEVAVLTLEASGLAYSQLNLRHTFELENLEILGDPYRSEDIEFVNGSLSHSVSVSWQLRPLRVGAARVYDITVTLRGIQLDLAGKALEVVEHGPYRPRGARPPFMGDPLDPQGHLFGRRARPWGSFPRRGAPRVYASTSVEPATAVQGQQLTLTVYLYSDVDLPIINTGPLPALPGFWVRELPLPANLTAEMVTIDGRRLGRMPLFRKVLFPLRPGRFTVPPVQVEVLAERPGLRFFETSTVRLLAETEPVALDIKPLPPSPAGFVGCVGDLAVGARVEPASIRLGDASTLTLTLRGDGHLQAMAEPELTLPPGLASTRPASETRETVSGGKLMTDRILRYPVIPSRAGRFELDLEPVAYFDPAAGAFRQASPGRLSLEVLPRLVAGGDGDTVPHGLRMGSAAGPASRRGGASLLPWLFAVPWVLGLVGVLARRRRSAEAEAPATPAVRLRRRLASLPPGLTARETVERIEHAWREFLTARWKLTSGLAPHRWAPELLHRGVPEAAAEALARLVQDLELLRHAPQLAATGCLRDEILASSLQLARALK